MASYVGELLLDSLLLHFAAIKIQEAKDSIDEEDPRPTSFTWSYINLPRA